MRLTWVTSSEITALRPTSLPVPAVVGQGHEVRHRADRVGRRACRPRSRTASPGWVASSATALATSSAAPPPMPTIESASCAAKAAAPATTCDSTGLPRTPSKISGSWPAGGQVGDQVGERRAARPTPESVTTSGRLSPVDAEVLDQPSPHAGAEADVGGEAEAMFDGHGARQSASDRQVRGPGAPPPGSRYAAGAVSKRGPSPSGCRSGEQTFWGWSCRSSLIGSG